MKKHFLSVTWYNSEWFYSLYYGRFFFNSEYTCTLTRTEAKIFLHGKKMQILQSLNSGSARTGTMRTRVYRIEPPEPKLRYRRRNIYRLIRNESNEK